jgi:PQQ-dependent dehydrogenase (methanol/ethanol family)
MTRMISSKAIATLTVLAATAALTQGSVALASGQSGRSAVPAQPPACCTATSANSPKVGGNLGDQDYSSLAQVSTANVTRLRGAWVHHFTEARSDLSQESTPAEVDGVIYEQDWQGNVYALSATTGRQLWKYSSGLPGEERGVAVGDGMVFSGLGGEHVVALNQKTGKVAWQVQVGTAGQDDASKHAFTAWVEYYDGLVLTGTANGGVAKMRGHLYALHAATGSLAWSFGSTAGPGDPNSGSWPPGKYLGGGGDVWIGPAIEPKLGLLYITFGNPDPLVTGGQRAGDNLYDNSIVALHVSTGKLAWYFQSVHHDLWDYDNEMWPVIANVRYAGTVREVVIYGSKTGWLYYLDPRTGKPVIPVREKPVPVVPELDSSPTQPIPAGNSLVPTCPQKTGPTQVIPGYLAGCEFTPGGQQAVMDTPGRGGGSNWEPLSFSHQTGLLYVPASEVDTAWSNGKPYGQPTSWAPAGEREGGVLDAVNPQTNKLVWQVKTKYPVQHGEGILTTAGGLLFEGALGGLFYARSAATGRELWTWQTGDSITSTPITYSVQGTQYVAVFACATSVPCNLWAFKLGGPVKAHAQAPPRPALRGLISGMARVPGSVAADTVDLGVDWTAGAPGSTEDLSHTTAMAPDIMSVQAGTTVRFTNPATNANDHCADSFFDPASFKVGPLAPGQSRTVTFTRPGDYYYTDCPAFVWNTGEIIVR